MHEVIVSCKNNNTNNIHLWERKCIFKFKFYSNLKLLHTCVSCKIHVYFQLAFMNDKISKPNGLYLI